MRIKLTLALVGLGLLTGAGLVAEPVLARPAPVTRGLAHPGARDGATGLQTTGCLRRSLTLCAATT